MENRFEHSPQEKLEEQGWGAYATPPRYNSRQAGLCADVCKMLPDLLENDGSVRPEMAVAINAHLAVCSGCSQEYDQMQRVIARIEALPPAEMPMDYSGLIMQQIQAKQARREPIADKTAARPFPNTVSAAQTLSKTVTPTAKPIGVSTTVQTADSRLTGEQQSRLTTQTGVQVWQRLTLGAMLSGMLAFFLNSAWGRQMLGVNLANATSWLEQLGESMSRMPVMGGIIGLVFSALAQASGLLSETYHSLGSLAARGLALDIAMGALAYYYVLNRRQREQRLGV